MRYLLLIIMNLLALVVSGQTTLFKETFKNLDYYDGPANEYTYYDNSSSMYSEDIVRIANSTNPSNYPGASAGSYIYLGPISSDTNRPLVVISGINTSGHNNIRLSFGAATWYGMASDYMEISYSTDGSNWTVLDDNDLLSGYYVSAAWGKVTLNQQLPASVNLRLKIYVSGPNTVKFDDLLISGWQSEGVPPSAPSNLSYSDLVADQLLLKWDPSADNVGIARYDIYKGNIFITSSLSNQARISYLTPGTSVVFKVQAVDHSENKSAFSDELTIPVPELPADHIYSWERDHARVLENGDLEWQREEFIYEPGPSVRYIDFEGGNDNNDGLSQSAPWQHHPWDPAATWNAAACKGIHTYVFKRGIVYRGTLEALESGVPGNPIRLTSDPGWGSGEACIYGSRRFTSGWTKANAAIAPKIPDPDKVWYQDITGTMPNTKMVCEIRPDGIKRVYLARTPNYRYTPDDPLKTWPVWTNKEAYDEVNKNLWLADTKNLIQSDPQYYAGGTVWSQEDKNVMCTVWGQKIKEFDPSKDRIAVSGQNFGGKGCHYYIENTPYLLDTVAEYYWDNSAKRMFIRLPEDKDPNTAIIEVATAGKLILIDNKHDILISGLTFGFTTWDAVRWNNLDFVACIQLTGTCTDIKISHNKFSYVNGAVCAKNSNSADRTAHDIEVSDNDLQVVGDMGIAFINNGNVYFDKVKILRNRIYDSGARHLGSSWGNIPAITAYLIDGEVAGNIVDVSWGNGVNVFWGKNGTDAVTSLPFIRGLTHHNKASNTLIGCNDYGGIENWQGGPAYFYNNISHNASGFKHFNNTSVGYAFYHDGSFKQYIFNNIASGVSWIRNNASFIQVLGFYNMYVHNTGFRTKAFHVGSAFNLDSGGHNSYMGNLADSVSYHYKTSLKTDQVPFESFGYNLFSQTPFRGGMATNDEERKNYWSDKILVDLQTYKKNLQSYKPHLDQVGIEALMPVLPMAHNNDFRPDPESEAIDRGVKFFASFPLYANVGEWNFYKHPADSSVIMADNFYMTSEYSDRETYYTVHNNNLKAHGVTPGSFVKGELEDWTDGALKFDGIQTWCELDHTVTSSKVCTNVDMTTNDFIIEVFFRVEKGHTGGVIIAKYGPSSNGYQLDIDENGKARLSLIESGTPAYSLSSLSSINDSSWHHVLAEINRKVNVNIYIDGKINNGTSSGSFPSSTLSLDNISNLLIGRNHSGNYLKGSLDFLRISKGTLMDARTTIQELYKWETDGPFLKDITGKKPVGRRDAGAIEVGIKTCQLGVLPDSLTFPMNADTSYIIVDSETGFKVYKTSGPFISCQILSDTLVVKVTENSQSLPRTGEIWITGCNDSHKIRVLQAAAPCKVKAESDTILLSPRAVDTLVRITTTTPLSIFTAGGFISIETSPSYDSLKLKVSSNPTSSRRTGYVYLNGCMSDTIVVIQETAVGMEDMTCWGFNIYPNPSKEGRFYITVPCLTGKALMMIQDIYGKVLYQTLITDEKREIEFKHPKGIYILKVFDRGKCYTRKILII